MFSPDHVLVLYVFEDPLPVLQNFTKVQMALNLWSWVPDTHVGCPEVECREILDTRMLDVKIWHATWESFEGSPTCVNFMIRRSFPRSKYVATESKIPKKHPSITMRKPPRSARIQKHWHEPTKILADVRFDRVLSYFCDCRKAQVYAPEPYSRNHPKIQLILNDIYDFHDIVARTCGFPSTIAEKIQPQ